MSLRVNHGTTSFLTKDPHSLSFSQRMEEFLEASLPKIGPRRMDLMIIGEIKMKKLGYFLLTTLHK